MLLLHLAIAWQSRDLIRKGYPDFTIFYSAGKIVGEGFGADLYDAQTQYRIQQEFASGVSIRKGALPYNHPPFEALIFVPFARLPYFAAYLLWDSLNVLILLVLPLALRRQLVLPRLGWGMGWLAISVAVFPVFVALLQAQDIIFLLLIYVLTFLALKSSRDFAAGAWLGLGLFRFHLVLPFLLILLVHKRKRAAFGFVTVALALGLISLATVGWRGIVRYPTYLLHVENSLGRGAIVSADMPNLRGFFDALLGTNVPPGLTTLLVLVASVVLLIRAGMLWKPASTGMQFDLGFALCVVVTGLVSYHSFIYDLSLLLVPLWILASHSAMIRRADGWTRFALLTPVLVLMLSPLQIVLVMRYGRASFLVPFLLLWTWGMARLLARVSSLATQVSAAV